MSLLLHKPSQDQAVDSIRSLLGNNAPNVGLYVYGPPGSGKTFAVLRAIFGQTPSGKPPRVNGEYPRVVVCAPQSIHAHWIHVAKTYFDLQPEEIETFAYTKHPRRILKIITDTQITKLEQPVHMVIIDEAHRLVNADTETYKTYQNVFYKIESTPIVALSGTPFQNHADDMFTTLALIKRRKVESIKNNWVNSDESSDIRRECCVSIDGLEKYSEFIEMTDLRVTFSKPEAVRYNALLKNKDYNMLALRTYTTCTTEDVENKNFTAKMRRLLRHLEEKWLSKPNSFRVAIVSESVQFLEIFKELSQLGTKNRDVGVFTFTGKTTDRAKVLTEFKSSNVQNTRHLLFIGSEVGGEGIDLSFVDAAYLVDACSNYNPYKFRQIIGRFDRNLSKRIKVYRMIVKWSCDEVIASQYHKHKLDFYRDVMSCKNIDELHEIMVKAESYLKLSADRKKAFKNTWRQHPNLYSRVDPIDEIVASKFEPCVCDVCISQRRQKAAKKRKFDQANTKPNGGNRSGKSLMDQVRRQCAKEMKARKSLIL